MMQSVGSELGGISKKSGTECVVLNFHEEKEQESETRLEKAQFQCYRVKD
jgi:hypothetical protein